MNIKGLVGILIAHWLNDNLVIAIGCGTAVAINPRTIFTCTHNLYNQSQRRYCDYVEFIPNIDNTHYSKSLKIHRSESIKKFKYLELTQQYREQPTKQQIAFIPLIEPLAIQNFAKFGNILPHETGKEIILITYPAIHCQKPASVENLIIKREIQTGKLFEPEKTGADNIVKYQIKTSLGCSGASGFIKNDKGIYKIVLMHTHGGADKEKYNLGLYFGQEIIVLIDQFLRELERENAFPHGDYMEEQLIQVLKQRKQFQQFHNEESQKYFSEPKHEFQNASYSQEPCSEFAKRLQEIDQSQKESDSDYFMAQVEFLGQEQALSNKKQQRQSPTERTYEPKYQHDKKLY